jgi:hypothetical protein
MAELRRRAEDEQTSATATSTRPATSTANAREGTQREQIEHRSAHDTAIEVERLRHSTRPYHRAKVLLNQAIIITQTVSPDAPKPLCLIRNVNSVTPW